MAHAPSWLPHQRRDLLAEVPRDVTRAREQVESPINSRTPIRNTSRVAPRGSAPPAQEPRAGVTGV